MGASTPSKSRKITRRVIRRMIPRALTARTGAARLRARGTPVEAGGDMTIRRRPWMVLLVGLFLGVPLDAGAFDVYRSEEATIADIHAALGAKTLTCRGLV